MKTNTWSYGAVPGISLSSVTLDSLFTNDTVRTNTDRPAFIPSFSAVLSYSAISHTVCLGVGYINKTS